MESSIILKEKIGMTEEEELNHLLSKNIDLKSYFSVEEQLQLFDHYIRYMKESGFENEIENIILKKNELLQIKYQIFMGEANIINPAIKNCLINEVSIHSTNRAKRNSQ